MIIFHKTPNSSRNEVIYLIFGYDSILQKNYLFFPGKLEFVYFTDSKISTFQVIANLKFYVLQQLKMKGAGSRDIS